MNGGWLCGLKTELFGMNIIQRKCLFKQYKCSKKLEVGEEVAILRSGILTNDIK